MKTQDASFTVTKVEGEGESITSVRKKMVDALKGMPTGRPVLGVIRDALDVSEPDVVSESLTKEEKLFKKELIEFLFKNLIPPDMGSKFRPEQARALLRRKLEKQSLGELKRFWKRKGIPTELAPEDLEDLHKKWQDISP